MENRINKNKYTVELSQEEEELSILFENWKIEEQRKEYDDREIRASNNDILSSQLYKFIQGMPKASLLHHHFLCSLSLKYFCETVLKQIDSIMVNQEEKVLRAIRFEEDLKYLECGFTMLKDSIKYKDEADLESQLTDYLILKPVDKVGFDGKYIWELFQNKLEGYFTLFAKKSHYESYLRHYFQRVIDEGIINCQTKFIWGGIRRDEDPYQFLSLKEELDLMISIFKEYQEKYPYFTFNIILSFFRFAPNEEIEQRLEKYIELKESEEYKDYILAFDLLCYEATRKSIEFVESLLKYKGKIPFVIHAGESLYHSNSNAIDSILLGCERIGHGLNLFRFPLIYQDLKEKNICIESCPLSNSILYHTDLKTHPIISYLNAGLKVTVSSDDDGIMGTNPMNLDLYACVSQCDFNFRDIKQLMENSIECSLLDFERKSNLRKDWEKRLKEYIVKFI